MNTERQRAILRAQLRIAVAIHDHAAELILASRLGRCETPACQRAARPDSPWCPACFRRFVTGHLARPERRTALPRWAR